MSSSETLLSHSLHPLSTIKIHLSPEKLASLHSSSVASLMLLLLIIPLPLTRTKIILKNTEYRSWQGIGWFLLISRLVYKILPCMGKAGIFRVVSSLGPAGCNLG